MTPLIDGGGGLGVCGECVTVFFIDKPVFPDHDHALFNWICFGTLFYLLIVQVDYVLFFVQKQ